MARASSLDWSVAEVRRSDCVVRRLRYAEKKTQDKPAGQSDGIESGRDTGIGHRMGCWSGLFV